MSEPAPIPFPPGRFGGQQLRRWTTGRLTFEDSFYAAELRHPRHVHARDSLCLVRRGLVIESWGSEEHRCPGGSIIYYPAGTPHADRCEQRGATCFIVEFDPGWLRTIAPRPAPLGEPKTTRGIAAHLVARIRSELVNYDEVSDLAVEGLAMELVAVLCRAGTIAPAGSAVWMRQVVDYLHTHFRAPVKLRDVAVVAGVHPVHLARVFRRQHGCTIGGFVRQLRIEWSRDLLMHSRMGLAELAAAAGFADQAHFSRTFRQATGMSPSAFRRAASR